MRADDISPPAMSLSNGFPLLVYPEQVTGDSTKHSDASLVASLLPDTDLYNYYLEHVLPGSDTSSRSHVHLTLKSLAQESHLLLYSLLAVSAVRLAWDMISQKVPPEMNEVHMVLMRGYQHYNMASKSMRMKLSRSSTVEANQVMTSTLMVLPFAAASQQISHWLSTQSTNQCLYTPLSSTPRDVITFVRGARTIMETLLPILSIAGTNATTDANRDSTATTGPYLTTSERLYKQETKSIIVSDSCDAWSQLQRRLGALCYDVDDPLNHEVSACKVALDVLVHLRTSTITVLTSPHPTELHIEDAPSKHATSWLHSFVRWPCRARVLKLSSTG
jgi:hypothetical protein